MPSSRKNRRKKRKNKKTKKSSRFSIQPADRISELPDPILCHILSFLPTKQAATTSVLSKRWKTLWLSVFTLDFNYETFKDFHSFYKFVDSTMFSLRDKTIPIQSFSLKCDRSSRFTQQNYKKIFKSAMIRGVQNLNFHMSDKIHLINLPPRIFSLKMLQVLKLMNIRMRSCDQVDFPHLKILHLKSVDFDYRKDIVKFLLGCPILEDLQYSKALETPLFLEDMTMENLSALPNLVKVRIFNWHIPMTLICKAEILHMKEVMWMNWTKLPVFHNLILLELSFKNDRVYGEYNKSFLGILPHVPKLQHFKIQDCFGALTKRFKCWKDPPIVAECLSLQLKTFCIRGYSGSEYEFGLAKYIMQHSKVLEIMTIQSTTCGLEKDQMRLKLSSCTMGSTTCKLVFD